MSLLIGIDTPDKTFKGVRAVVALYPPTDLVNRQAESQIMFGASRAERRLLAFSRESFTGTLTELESISLPLRPEQISIDANNVLWVAGPARLPEISGASRVVRIFLGSDGVPQSQETVYAGSGITAATSAARGESQLFIGSFRDEKILSCDLK